MPVKLPEKVRFGKGNPLETAKSWINVKCLKCGNYGHTFKFCKESVVVKSVKFVPACKTISKSGNSAPVSVGLNRFAMLCDDVLELDLDLEFDLDDIVWGVGLKYMMGKSWADVCGV